MTELSEDIRPATAERPRNDAPARDDDAQDLSARSDAAPAIKADSKPEAAPPGPAGAASSPSASEPRKPKRGRFILMALLLLALAGGGWAGYDWWTVGRFEVSTDDAYIGANMSILSAQVSGYVASVEVSENQAVRKGDVIARIDDGDYRLAVQSAEDKIATADASVKRIAMQAEAARASIEAAHAQVLSAQAELKRAATDLARRVQLTEKKVVSIQTLDNARADRDKAAAALSASQANFAVAQANLAVLNAQKLEAEGTLAELKTALDKAERDLSFTVIRAPIDGVVGNKSVEVGQLVQPGSRLAAVVPLDDVYVDANFKETQLAAMHPGQLADIEVDAFPNHHFEGRIDSISPASGSLFSLLPPENATGNFTKIVQRLPVRVHFTPEATSAHVLRPGMSVVVTVDTRSDAEKAGKPVDTAARAGN